MPPKKKIDGHILTLYIGGTKVNIVSPVSRDKFLEEMVNDISENGAKAQWSGWYGFTTPEGKRISVMIRTINAVEGDE